MKVAVRSRPGLCPRLSAAVRTEIERLALEGLIRNGIMVAAYVDGEPAVSAWASSRSGEQTARRIQEDSLVMAYSVAKGVSATALCTAVSAAAKEGRLPIDNYFDAPVSTIWPEFAARQHAGSPKKHLTIAEVSGYRGGMTEHPPLAKLGQLWFKDRSWQAQWDYGIEFVEAYEPEWGEPERLACYHPISFSWLVGGIVERCSSSSSSCANRNRSSTSTSTSGNPGTHISDVVRMDIAEPLRAEDEMYLGRLPRGPTTRQRVIKQRPLVPPAARAEMTAKGWLEAQYNARFMCALGNNEPWGDVCLPSSNGFFSARALAALYGAWANGGRTTPLHCGAEKGEEGGQQVQLIDSELVAEVQARIASPNRLFPAKTSAFAPVGTTYRDSLGFHPYAHEEPALYGPADTASQTIGCAGAGGSVAFADPSRGLGVAILKADSTESRLGTVVAERLAQAIRDNV